MTSIKSTKRKTLALYFILSGFLFSIFSFSFGNSGVAGHSYIDTPLIIKRCVDFIINGKGNNPEWQKAKSVALTQIDSSGRPYKTNVKILYSPTGLYVLFNCEDQKITSPFANDFEDLYNGDVCEVFFHPDPAEPLYFEYEVSPLEKELVLLISNKTGKFARWMPWHYEDYKVVKKVSVPEEQMKNGNNIPGWNAELFFPNSLLNVLNNMPPKSGMRWNANFCRLDYDGGKMIKWSWSPIRTSFHEFKKYLPVQFE